MFGVSRNSVREALRQLELLTLVERRRGDGTYVRELDPVQLMAPFGALIATSAAAVEDVLEFRRTFEPEVAALAALKVDDDGRARWGAPCGTSTARWAPVAPTRPTSTSTTRWPSSPATRW